MKKVIILLVVILLTSCEASHYVQIYKTNYGNGQATGTAIVFEDKNCVVSYYLWSPGGNMGFNIYNKTESDMTINLKRTFFVMNGINYEYFQNRTFSNSSNTGSTVTEYNKSNYVNPYTGSSTVTAVSGTNSSSTGVSYMEKPELIISPNTSININEFAILNTRYYKYNLEEYPKRNRCSNVKFDVTNSPFIFSNIISYTVNKDTLKFQNKFFVNEISNYSINDDSLGFQTKYNHFYIEYTNR